MNFKLKVIISIIFIYGLFCFLSLNRHSNSKIYTYHSEIWADKAGYNVYLPSLFIYDFNGSKFPKQIVEHTGYGFAIDSTTSKVITKYPYGVSLLQSPFWLIAHLLSSEKNGFSLFYQKSIDFAGSFYLTQGLFFLFFIIRKYKSLFHSILLSLGIIISTGIFYYGIFETGMSHIYSFCCLAAILFMILNYQSSTFQISCLIILSLIYVLIRPLNIIFLTPILFFYIYNGSLKINLSAFKKTHLILLLSIIILLLIPQLLYYNYAFGSFVTDSYKNEPFLFPSPSRIFELLVSPNNGLLLYYPIIIGLLIYYFITNQVENKLIFSLLIIYIIVYASWWSLSLGCGFGHRAINDIILIFFLPIITSSKQAPKWFYGFFIVCVLINIKFIFSYDTCLHKSLNFNYLEYKSILFGEFK